MSCNCSSGNPCYSGAPIVYTTYPKGCTTSTQGPWTLPLRSEDVYYSGPALPNANISTTDLLTVAIQKLDNALTPSELVAAIIEAITADDTLRAALCTALSCT